MDQLENRQRLGLGRNSRPYGKRHPHHGHSEPVVERSDAAFARAAALQEQLDAVRRERDSLQRLVFDGAQVQRALSAPRQLRRGPFDIAGEVFPLRHVSGDFLHAFDAGQETVLAIGDIAGKGLAAGMWFTHLVGLVRMLGAAMEDPAEVASAVNRHLASMAPDPPTATLFVARLNASTGELHYCNAGHPAPLLLRRDGRQEWLLAGGPLLGAVPNAAFAGGRIVLSPGDTVLSYSDGVSESRNAADEDFGLLRIVAAARCAAGSSARSTLFSVLGAAQDFAGAQPGADDIAMMVVHYPAETQLASDHAFA